MAFFQQSEPKNLGLIFAQGLSDLRSAYFKLAHCKGSASGMSDEEFGEEFGYVAEAGAAKAEVLSGLGHLLDGNAGVTCAQQKAAVDQMLNQFGH